MRLRRAVDVHPAVDPLLVLAEERRDDVDAILVAVEADLRQPRPVGCAVAQKHVLDVKLDEVRPLAQGVEMRCGIGCRREVLPILIEEHLAEVREFGLAVRAQDPDHRLPRDVDDQLVVARHDGAARGPVAHAHGEAVGGCQSEDYHKQEQ